MFQYRLSPVYTVVSHTERIEDNNDLISGLWQQGGGGVLLIFWSLEADMAAVLSVAVITNLRLSGSLSLVTLTASLYTEREDGIAHTYM